ncbi:putative plant self-incompatibility S1 [Lupinus albus]|uniref:S-protein homolog n=1 Tax=Lupinus albus TaxID=3870 RepID=A0A6A4QGQ0_LUPAL|nr:putative plant self-incompatibility S1 [Lupinus albus]
MVALLENKSVLLLMLLTIFVTLQMMSGVVSGGFFDETKVTITNKLSQALTIHCQDKNNDDGYHVLQPSAGHRFKFFANPFFKKTLWFCSFQWTGESHTFDIYVQKRDKCHDRRCYWLITKHGPCRIIEDYNHPKCFPWNDKVNS